MANNAVAIAGNLTRDPELKYTNSGRAVCRMGLAYNSRKRNADGNWEDGDPEYYNVTVWGQLGENAAELEKGQRVVVIGTLRYHSWQDSDGSNRSAVEIVADELGTSVLWAHKSNGNGDAVPTQGVVKSADEIDDF
jgi:single-strand DNA-binding protein